MNFLTEALGISSASIEHFGHVILRLFATMALAAMVAFRPWRRLLGQRPLKSETAQAQVLIAVSGALMVAVIGDSMARAFGLVGLGGFIRFRSGIKDPRDAAVMFIMIGIGMACGLGLVPLALVATCFAALMLIAFDVWGTVTPERKQVAFAVDDGPAALPMLRATWPRGRVISAPEVGGAPTKIVFELELPETVDAATLLEAARAAGVPGLREVGIIDD
ncbi:MAG: DUF4956 domain-containing protein [Kofleriaceae bacterium]